MIPGLGPDSTLLLEAEIAKRIRQGETTDLNPVQTRTVLGGLAGSRDPLVGLVGLGLSDTLARRKLINDIYRGRLPLKDERTELIDEIYGLDDPVDTLQAERRKILKEIYGFDPLEVTLGDDVLEISSSPVDTRNLIDRIYGLDSAAADRRLLRKLLLERRLRKFRNPLNRRFGLRNPYIIRDIIGR